MKPILCRLGRIFFRLAVIAVVALTAFFLMFDKNLRQIINDYASSVAETEVNRAVDEEVYRFLSDYPVQYGDLVHIVYGNDGNVRSLALDSIAVDRIKAGAVSRVEKSIGELKEFRLAIPFGTILGNEFTVNRGPKLRMDMTMSPVVHSDLVSRFESAGINQTLHKIDLTLTVEIYIVLPWYRSSASVTCHYILAETVIVGTVPDAYTMVIETPGDDTAGLINDYGAENHNP